MKRPQNKPLLLLLGALCLSSCSFAFNPVSTTSGGDSGSGESVSGSGDSPVSSGDGSSSNSGEGESSSNSSSVSEGVIPLSANNVDSPENWSTLNSSHLASSTSIKILVIPFCWSDQTDRKTTDNMTMISNGYFGTVADTKWNSLKTYFETMSYGKLSVSGYVTDWYTSTLTYAEATSGEKVSGGAWETNIKKVWDGACTFIRSNYSSMDFSEYDSNNDGYIDNVQFVNTGDKDFNSYLSWGFQTVANEYYTELETAPKVNSELTLGNIAWFNIDFLKSTNDYIPLPSGAIGTRVITHEFGHVIGLPDYYDTSYTKDNSDKYMDALGTWDMQSYNCLDWNSFSKFSSGYMNPKVIRGDQGYINVTLRPATSSGDCLIIPARNQDYNGTPFDEYLIVDLYTPTGLNEYDAGKISSTYNCDLSQAGVRIYHVDAMENNTGGLKLDNDWNEDGIYNLLLLQKGGTPTFMNKAETRHTLNDDDFWKANDTFTMRDYASFFHNGTFHNGLDLGYKIEVQSCSSTSATLKISVA